MGLEMSPKGRFKTILFFRIKRRWLVVLICLLFIALTQVQNVKWYMLRSRGNLIVAFVQTWDPPQLYVKYELTGPEKDAFLSQLFYNTKPMYVETRSVLSSIIVHVFDRNGNEIGVISVRPGSSSANALIDNFRDMAKAGKPSEGRYFSSSTGVYSMLRQLKD